MAHVRRNPNFFRRMPKKNVATMSLNRPAALLSSSDSICASVIAAAWRCPCQGLGRGGGVGGGLGWVRGLAYWEGPY